jgi:hypothetical protein
VGDGMELEQIRELLSGVYYHVVNQNNWDCQHVFASDLMSDCLALINEHCILVTGLSNVQALRTAEVLDLNCIIFVRGKVPTKDMIEIAKESGITLISTQYSMFETSGILYSNGLKAIRTVDVI